MTFNPDEPAGVLVKTTLVDFPGIVACSFFLPGCNLRCTYCYNTDLAVGKLPSDSSTASLNQLYAHLEKRKNVLAGITISGGEPLLNPKLPEIILKAKSLGYKVKLDTNGTLPEKLEKLVHNKDTCPDFIAMDIKTSPANYNKLIPGTETFKLEQKLTASIEIISDFPADKREWRTVLVPSLVSQKDISVMASILPEDASWQFAPFVNKNCLSSSFTEMTPYTDSEILSLVNLAKQIIPGAKLR